jgi:hypothetical protein
MIPFDGRFAQDYVYPFAFGAYNADQPPPGYTAGTDAFEILADLSPAFRARLESADAKHRKPLQSMLDHSRRPRITDPSRATSAAVQAMPRNPQPNQHFGWLCVDAKLNRLVVSFRGTEFFKDWLDDFDFTPEPYRSIPGRGTVHQGFQIVYEAVRENLRKLVQSKAPGCKELLITGHSLGGALSALSAPDLLNDVAANLAPIVYTWAEPRVGHMDFVQFFDTRVNICYRIVNLWDVVPHLPPPLALYEHEGSSLHIDSGFTLDIVHNHVLITGYAPGIDSWNKNHPSPGGPLVGKTV